jgi:ATP-binding cassette subfamily B protein
MSRRPFFVPEVIQTSMMDCGPASLKCLLQAFGVSASYGRLREACQTDVDGTSIDVLEDVARQLGLHAEQMMVPLDHLLVPASNAFPALLVVRNPDGNTHFVIAWRRVGPLVEIMDPASGRRWMSGDQLLRDTFTHAMPVPAEAWRDWAADKTFSGALRARLQRLKIGLGDSLVTQALEDPTWRSIATLDAATRMTDALVEARGVKKGSEATGLLQGVFDDALRELHEPGRTETCIPGPFWSAGPTSAAEDGAERVMLRGAVLIHVEGRLDRRAAAVGRAEESPPLSPELAAALHEKPRRPLREIVRMLREDGFLAPSIVLAAALFSALAATVEALVLRGVLGVGVHLGTWWYRGAAMLALAVFFALLLGLELPILSQTMRMGRRLELRLRMAFLAKIPRLQDRYFATRPTSDMSHRAHAIHVVSQLPQVALRMVRALLDLAIVSIGIAWLDPGSWPYVLATDAACVLLPFVAQRALLERDARVRVFDGSLARFYLDALLGLVALRTHGAGRALRREHEEMLVEYRRAFVGLVSAATTVDAFTGLVGVAMTIGLVAQYLGHGGEAAGSLLLVYWALSLPLLGADFADAMRRYPELRNTIERLLEPLGALEDETGPGGESAPHSARAAEIRFSSVTVRATGRIILRDVDVEIAPATHLAIIGPSGAGKSSLCGLLLGWHRAAEGAVLIDGSPLAGEALLALRRQTAWVDPAIQLWNRSLLANVAYGSTDVGDVSPALEAADVVRILEQLPDGLQTSLGDGGALLSGGEGQRVRFARAMLRTDSRLVVLDEPFRGLDREKRRDLLARARQAWAGATLLCVTHDVGETLDFDRVVVVEDGRIVEDGRPRELAADARSRYRAMLDSERSVRTQLWRDRGWRRVELRAGVLAESPKDLDR